jgi:hypothetical protein
VQQVQQPGAAAAGEQDTGDLHQALQQRGTALVSDGQPVDLLSKVTFGYNEFSQYRRRT